MKTENFQMDIVPFEQRKRLPVYFLLDCSAAMSGTPIAAVQQGMSEFTQAIKSDPDATYFVKLGIISFDNNAHLLTGGLRSMWDFQPPQLTTQGSTSWGHALRLLQHSLDTDV